MTPPSDLNAIAAPMRYFINEPDYGLTWFKTEPEWIEAVEGFDFLGGYCDDGWSEGVENITAGAIPNNIAAYNPDANEEEWEEEDEYYDRYAVYEAKMVNETKRPDNVGEDGYSPDGEYWGEFQYRCSYAFDKIVRTGKAEGG